MIKLPVWKSGYPLWAVTEVAYINCGAVSGCVSNAKCRLELLAENSKNAIREMTIILPSISTKEIDKVIEVNLKKRMCE
jgi:hypothetical protein